MHRPMIDDEPIGAPTASNHLRAVRTIYGAKLLSGWLGYFPIVEVD